MAKIEQYKDKKGNTLYKFQVYTGVNPKTGKRSQTTRRGFKTKTAANQALKVIESKVASGEYWKDIEKKKEDYTLLELIEEYHKVRSLNVKPGTIRTYNIYANRFKTIYNIKINKLSASDILDMLNKSTLAPYTKSQTFSYIKKILQYAYDNKYIDNLILTSDMIPKNHDIEEKKENFYTTEELKEFFALIKDINIKYFTLYRLLAFSGLRIGEALALKWEDVDFKNNIINVYKTTVRTLDRTTIIAKPKTATSIRTVEIDQKTINQLIKYHEFNNSTYIFSNNNKLPEYNTISNYHHKLMKHLDIKRISLHGFRHSHASLLFDNGVPIKIVQKRLGHANINITFDVYTHVTKENEKNAMASFFEKIDI